MNLRMIKHWVSKSIKRHSMRRGVPWLHVISFTLLSLYCLIFTAQLQLENQSELPTTNLLRAGPEPHVSVIILTYKKYTALAKLLPSILTQQGFNFEVILVDNGCLDETKKVISDAFSVSSSNGGKKIPHKYLSLCDNPGYAAGNNAGVKLAEDSSEWLLFLNDDVVLSEPTFLQNMVQLGETKRNAVAVGCKLVTADGDEMIEAGSIVWNDGSAAGYGRGRKDINAPEFSYSRPVDYISGACLLTGKQMFTDYGGFDGDNFPNYYEDTDLQLHIQHDLGKEVWFQPLAVARHDEHGSFGTDESTALMEKASKKFKAKWINPLSEKHIAPPFTLPQKDREKAMFQASDLNARNPRTANILYIDQTIPNKSKGSGFGRSFDNLSMIVDLGHRVTLVTLHKPAKDWCDETCVNEIESLGVEYIPGEWDEAFQSRIDYYDIVLVSRPSTLKGIFTKLRAFYKQNEFALVYDCEALWFRRDEMRMDLVVNEKIAFPSAHGMSKLLRPDIASFAATEQRQAELALLSMADTVIPVSDGEKQLVQQLDPGVKNIHTIGHVMRFDRATKKQFNDRNGILFLASFHNNMYYNGDAIWYFLQEIYPLVIQESSTPIPLTIAGRGIPGKLRETVRKDEVISPHVTFLESPPTIDHLYEDNRIFIAPHLYGAGIQFKVSEALSFGIPVVVSTFTAKSFGFTAGESERTSFGCIGSSIESFKTCILDLHGNERKWVQSRKDGTDFFRQSHSRPKAMHQWSEVIDDSLKLISERRNLKTRKLLCAEGEKAYRNKYPNVANAIDSGVIFSAYQHWRLIGENEGKEYNCGYDHGLFTANYPSCDALKKPCPMGEEHYLSLYRDVRKAIKRGRYTSGFDHWKKVGKKAGRTYYCQRVVRDNQPKEMCHEGEEFYLNNYFDVLEKVEAGNFHSGFDHWTQMGKAEGKTYFCHRNKTIRDHQPRGMCPEGEEFYLSNNLDVLKAVQENRVRNGFRHWIRTGKAEGRVYYCNVLE